MDLTNDKDIKISVVIVNYRVKYFLEQTLQSTLYALSGINSEIIVIDNHSQDDSIPYLRNKFSNTTNIQFIENHENIGFARANNQGIKIARGAYTLILNPDTVITREVIATALELMETTPDCGGIGTKMIDGDGVFLPESKRGFPTPWTSFCKIFGLAKLFPKSKTFGKYHLKYLSADETHQVDILAGAFMLIRTPLLQQCGGFDESFFMYGEDIDLSYKLVQAGYQNYYIPTPIIHYKGESTKKDSFKYVKVFYEAMLIFFHKHYPNYSRVYAIFIYLAIGIRATAAIIKRILVAPFSTLRKVESKNRVWSITSNAKNRDKICKLISAEAEKAITTQTTDIIIDNESMNYDEIVKYISQNQSRNHHFHIYNATSNIIISPKMSN
ncbi:MAG: glycosyltransferase family 2 protein [Bacteroidales bacterium]